MKKTILNPASLGAPRGFSHGILTEGGRLLFLAGQTGSEARGRIVEPGDLVAQFDRALANLETVCREAGGSLASIVRLEIFVRDRDDYVAKLKPLGEVYRRRFGDYYPAMALFEVTGLFQEEALIELEAIAVVD